MEEGLTPAEAAARWLARLHADEVTDADRAAFEEWRTASPRHAAAFEEAQAAWEVFAVADADPHVRARQTLVEIAEWLIRRFGTFVKT